MHRSTGAFLALIILGILCVTPSAVSGRAQTPGAAPTQGVAPSPTPIPRLYTVRPGDTLGAIAGRFDVSVAEILAANNLRNADSLSVGQRLIIPGSAPLEAPTATPNPERASPVQRLPVAAQLAADDSPFYKNTWVTYYGRPKGDPRMGILGEYDLDSLIPLLRRQARVYDEANGADLGVTPALHLVYGMAVKEPGPDNSHLIYLDDETTQEYIDRAAWEGMGLILDVQIGNVSPLESIKPAFKFLKYNNVQLAIDPEFAMTTPGQEIPGLPPGTVLAEQVNEVQTAIVTYMQQEQIRGHKMLIVHQFLPWMIADKDQIKRLPQLDIVICADGWGPPNGKITKYNGFMTEDVQFAGFKLFYQWDEPLMNERQALGVDPYPNAGYIEMMPSLIVYQ